MTQPTIEQTRERIRQETEQMKKSALATLFNLGYGLILEQANDYYHHAGMGSRPKADVAIVRAITGLPLTAEQILDAYGAYLNGDFTLLATGKEEPEEWSSEGDPMEILDEIGLTAPLFWPDDNEETGKEEAEERR